MQSALTPWRTRFSIIAFLTYFPASAWPCTLIRAYPPSLDGAPIQELMRHNLASDYRSADAVFQATVLARTDLHSPEQPSFRMTLRIEKVWKTDGGPLETILSGRGGGDCSMGPLEAGVIYVVFAVRQKSFWSFLPWFHRQLYIAPREAIRVPPLPPSIEKSGQWFLLQQYGALQSVLAQSEQQTPK